MPTLLKNLMLEELSLVDRPANAQAMVSLFKRDDSQEDNMEEQIEKMGYDAAKLKAYMDEKGCTREEAMKALNMEKPVEKTEEEEVQETAKADAEVEALKAENERLRKSLIENGFVIKADAIEKKAEVEMIEVEGEMVAKCDIPAPVLKALEAAAVAKADAELTKKAQETLPHFDAKVAKELVKFDLSEDAVAALKAADTLFQGNMEEFGKSDASGEFASAKDEMDALVKNYINEHDMKKSDWARAYAAVAKTEHGKALINKSYKGE